MVEVAASYKVFISALVILTKMVMRKAADIAWCIYISVCTLLHANISEEG